MKDKTSLGGLLAILSTIGIYSSFTLLSRHAADTAVDPLDLAALRFGVGGAILLPVLLFRGLQQVALHQAVLLALIGGLVFANACYFGLAMAPATHGAVLVHGMLPVFGVLAGLLILGEPVSRQRLGGVLLVIVGASVATVAIAPKSLASWAGAALLLVGSICWAVFGALCKKWKVTALQATYIVTPIAALLYMPFYLLYGTSGLLTMERGPLLIQGIFHGVVIAFAAPLAYITAVHKFGAVRTGIATASVPLITTIGSYVLLYERHGNLVWVGVLVLTAGMVAALWRPATPPVLVRTTDS